MFQVSQRPYKPLILVPPPPPPKKKNSNQWWQSKWLLTPNIPSHKKTYLL